jgi:hypothetical protein
MATPFRPRPSPDADPTVTISSMHEGMAIPLDPHQFVDAFEVWAETEALLPSAEAAIPYCIANATQYLMDAGVQNIPAYMTRLIAIPQLYEAHEGVLSAYFQAGEGESIQVNLALIAAAATSRFILSEEYVGFDLDDLARQAAFYAAGTAPFSDALH